MPNLEASNILVEQPGYLAQAEGAGIVLGATFVLYLLTERGMSVADVSDLLYIAPDF